VGDVDPPAAEPPEETSSQTPHGGGRRYPSTIGGMFYLVVLGVTLVGIVIIATSSWRVGTRWVAGALLFAALARLVLPTRDAGMLEVRHRFVDCVMLAGVGALLVFLATTIPNQPL
jgi:DUF3017 family protein